jgi:subtilisin-like proprotein convertase family protein
MRLKLLFIILWVVPLLFVSQNVLAQPCAPATFTNSTPVGIVDNATRTSTIVVAGAPVYLTDLNLTTSITHTWCSDLTITLTSPAGTVVTITSVNGGSNDNVFNGTLWDDNAGSTNSPGSVTDNAFANNVVETPLASEEPLGAFIGENPNGTWTLSIADGAGGDQGTLSTWSLILLGRPTAPATASGTYSTTTPLSIVDNTTVTRTITVSGAGSQILDVNLLTNITHTWCNDLDITITSPSGTVVTLTTDNGGSFVNVFNGTLWDDKAGATNAPGAATDNVYASNVVETPLAPEEPLAAFIGENPNGTWTISIGDDAGGDTGVMSLATLTIVTSADVLLPSITTQPVNRTVCANENVSFSVAATPNATGYQWQAGSGGVFSNIAGANGTTLTLNNVTDVMNGYQYRVLVYGVCSQVISNTVTLVVNRLPIIVSLSASPLTKVGPGQTTSLTAVYDGFPGSFGWYRNNVLVNTTPTSTISNLTIDSLGVYKLIFTDINGCKATSADFPLLAEPDFRFFVFPNPNNGIFQVRFYSYTLGVKRTLSVFDSKGNMVFKKEFIMSGPYEKMDVDVSRYSKGYYHVELRDASGKYLGSGSALYIQ